MPEDMFDKDQEEEARLLEVALEQVYQCLQDNIAQKGEVHSDSDRRISNKRKKSKKQLNKRRGGLHLQGYLTYQTFQPWLRRMEELLLQQEDRRLMRDLC